MLIKVNRMNTRPCDHITILDGTKKGTQWRATTTSISKVSMQGAFLDDYLVSIPPPVLYCQQDNPQCYCPSYYRRWLHPDVPAVYLCTLHQDGRIHHGSSSKDCTCECNAKFCDRLRVCVGRHRDHHLLYRLCRFD